MSHMTVRRALNDLLNTGVIYTIPGKGIYVSPREKVEAETVPFVSFTEEMHRGGLRSSSILLESSVILANTVLAKILKISD